MKTALLSASLLLSVFSLRAQQVEPTVQQQLPAPYSLSVKSQLVVLDVVVTDKAGNVVPNLKKEDFRVTESKVPQTIRSLDAPGTDIPKAAPQISSTAELDKLEPKAPVSIIVLGEISTSFNDQAYARYSLQQYLKAQGDTLTQPTMLVAADAQHFMVLRDYTTSQKEVLAALDRHFANPPWAPLSGGVAQRLAASLLTLQTVAQATAGHPGHKNMIWIGNNRTGMRPNGMDPERAAAVEKAITNVTNLLRDSRVTLYTIDPGGVGSDNANISSGFDNTDPFAGIVSFNAVARATGGIVFRNRSDVDTLIATSLRDGINFYTLSYVPADSGNESKFRAIKITTTHPAYQVHTREGYFAASSAPAAVVNNKGKLDKGLVMDINTAGRGVMVYDGIPLTIARDPTDHDKFVLHIQATNSPQQLDAAGKPTPDLTLLIQTFDRKGKLLKKDGRFVTLHPNSALGPETLRPVDYPITVATAAPAARIRFVVRDNGTGKVGADNIYLVDPRTLDDPSIGLNPEKKH